MLSDPIDLLGFAAASLTTLCWLPQAARVIRTRDTRAISASCSGSATGWR